MGARNGLPKHYVLFITYVITLISTSGYIG